ncbi:MAG: beta-ketoacyl synthase chain length factor [Bacteroidota bacterium]
MPVYIQSAEAISPLETFQTETLLAGTVGQEEPGKEYFTCLHPDYKQFINPSALRRMSGVIRMGLAASRSCLERAGIEQPDGIIVGSGLGCVHDTARFLNQVIDQDEQLLNPTAFIQSTHNTVSGQIALMLGCKAYNLTFSQRSVSFETALLDAILLLREQGVRNLLLGGIDEVTEESHSLMVKNGCAKSGTGGVSAGLDPAILESHTPGAMAGEGASFFLLADQPSANSLARIDDLEIFHSCEGSGELKKRILEFLERNGLDSQAVDLLISGRNGDARYRSHYDEIEGFFGSSMVAAYKHLVGEYDTASAFGTWLAAQILSRNEVPQPLRVNATTREKISHILLFNYSKNRDFTLTLLSAL